MAFETRWRTSESMKLQNFFETASSVSAIQYTPDLRFFYQERLKKATKKASCTCTVACISVFGLAWKIGENEKKYHALSSENALVWTENASLVDKLFCFVCFKIKTGTSGNTLLGSRSLATSPLSTPRLRCIVLMSSQFL